MTTRLSTRAAVVSPGPATLDPETRSVEVTAATEAPVPVFDWERGEMVPEVLLMRGLVLPAEGRVPVLDSHRRDSARDVLGSAGDFRTEGGRLIATLVFSETAADVYQRVAEGHLRDVSVGYKVSDRVLVPKGQTRRVAGRAWEGPVSVVTSWSLREVSLTPIGADANAKTRQAPTDGGDDMTEKVRKLLERLGLDPQADDDEAREFLAGRSAAELIEAAAADAEAEDPREAARTMARADRERIRQAELARVRGLQELGARFLVPDEVVEGWIDGDVTVDQARADVLDLVAQRAARAGGDGLRVAVVEEDREKFRRAAVEALEIRSGARRIDDAQAGGDELASHTLPELAREALRMAGRSTRGDLREIVGRALTTSDFPQVLASTSQKFLMEGYTQAASSWREWAAVGSLPDFKPATIARAGDTSALVLVTEDGEFAYGRRSDTGETVKLKTYGLIVPITRQAIINDDLGALTDTPREQGAAAEMLLGDLAFGRLTANPVMSDGHPLFDATNHGNHLTGGAAAAPGFDSLAAARLAMKKQRDLEGVKRLNIEPRFFLAPEELWGTAEKFFASEMLDVATGSPIRNPFFGERIRRVYDTRLDEDSTTAWYLLGPQGKTVKLFFLNGNDRPYLETRDGWGVDGVEFKVRIDAAAAVLDWRAMVKNDGA